jgi:cell volume regulation protein A
VLLTALVRADRQILLDLNWTEALLVGAVVASTDAARCFCWCTRRACACGPVGATLEPNRHQRSFAVFLTLMLVELISIGELAACSAGIHPRLRARHHRRRGRRPAGGAGAQRVALPQGLHAPFVATAALVVSGGPDRARSGFSRFIAGIIIGNR